MFILALQIPRQRIQYGRRSSSFVFLAELSHKPLRNNRIGDVMP